MKRLLWPLVLFASIKCYSSAPTVEAPIYDYGTPTTVPISTSAWTMIPTSQTVGRVGVYVDVPVGNNANMVAHLGNCTSTSIATTVRPIEIVKGESTTMYPINDSVCMWVLSLHTSAENLHYQEIKKR